MTQLPGGHLSQEDANISPASTTESNENNKNTNQLSKTSAASSDDAANKLLRDVKKCSALLRPKFQSSVRKESSKGRQEGKHIATKKVLAVKSTDCAVDTCPDPVVEATSSRKQAPETGAQSARQSSKSGLNNNNNIQQQQVLQVNQQQDEEHTHPQQEEEQAQRKRGAEDEISPRTTKAQRTLNTPIASAGNLAQRWGVSLPVMRPLCWQFVQGHCSLGNECPKRHLKQPALDALRGKLKPSAPCVDHVRGACMRHNCHFLHVDHEQLALAKKALTLRIRLAAVPLLQIKEWTSTLQQDVDAAEQRAANQHTVCVDFVRGRCTRNPCRLLHPAGEILGLASQALKQRIKLPKATDAQAWSAMVQHQNASAPPASTHTVCVDFVRGRCTRNPCRLLHPAGEILGLASQALKQRIMLPKAADATSWSAMVQQRIAAAPPASTTPPPSYTVCVDYIHGRCSRQACKLLHPVGEVLKLATRALSLKVRLPKTTTDETSWTAAVQKTVDAKAARPKLLIPCRDQFNNICTKTDCRYTHQGTQELEEAKARGWARRPFACRKHLAGNCPHSAGTCPYVHLINPWFDVAVDAVTKKKHLGRLPYTATFAAASGNPNVLPSKTKKSSNEVRAHPVRSPVSGIKTKREQLRTPEKFWADKVDFCDSPARAVQIALQETQRCAFFSRLMDEGKCDFDDIPVPALSRELAAEKTTLRHNSWSNNPFRGLCVVAGDNKGTYVVCTTNDWDEFVRSHPQFTPWFVTVTSEHSVSQAPICGIPKAGEWPFDVVSAGTGTLSTVVEKNPGPVHQSRGSGTLSTVVEQNPGPPHSENLTGQWDTPYHAPHADTMFSNWQEDPDLLDQVPVTCFQNALHQHQPIAQYIDQDALVTLAAEAHACRIIGKYNPPKTATAWTLHNKYVGEKLSDVQGLQKWGQMAARHRCDVVNDIMLVAKHRAGQPVKLATSHHTRKTSLEKAISNAQEVLRKERKSGKCSRETIAASRAVLTLREQAQKKVEQCIKSKNAARFAADKYNCLQEIMSKIKNKSTTRPLFTKEQAEQWLVKEVGTPTAPKQPDSRFKLFDPPQLHMPAVKITADCIARALKGKKANSTPGDDGITNGALKQAGLPLFKVLASIFQEILDNPTAEIPPTWGSCRMSMLHKDGDPSKVENFRPISLTSVVGKLFHSVIRVSLERHLINAKIIDTGIQKGFVSKIQGCYDHIEALMRCIEDAAHLKKMLAIAQFDLKSAFPSVNHNKLWHVLLHFNVDQKVVQYLQRLYASASARIETASFSTKAVPVMRGVLQGDTLSPLLFIAFFSIVIRAVTDAEYKPAAGYSCKNSKLVHNVKAYADDITLIAGSRAQVTAMWKHMEPALDWCDLRIKESKCRIMLIKKGKLVEADNFKLGKVTIPCALSNGTKFLGCDLPRSMDSLAIKKFLRETIQARLTVISNSLFDTSAKVFFYETAVVSVMRWYFTIYPRIGFSTVRALQKEANRHLKRWFYAPQHTSPEVFTSVLGLDITDLRTLFVQCRAIGVARGLKNTDPVVQECATARVAERTHYNKCTRSFLQQAARLSATEGKNVERELNAIVGQATASEDSVKMLRRRSAGMIWALPSDPQLDKEFVAALWGLPNHTLRYASRALVDALTTNITCSRVIPGVSPFCPLCSTIGPIPQRQSLLHILAGCPSSLQQGRFTFRHDNVLKQMWEGFKAYGQPGSQIWVDLPENKDPLPQGYPSSLPQDTRPDLLVLLPGGHLHIVELTVPFESNMAKNHAHKMEKYCHLPGVLSRRFETVTLSAVEIGARGKLATSTAVLTNLLKYNRPSPNESGASATRKRMVRAALLSSEAIYRLRNDPLWIAPSIGM